MLRDAFNALKRGASWWLFGDYGGRVRAGCPGWLFLVDEFEDHRAAGSAAAFRAELAGRFVRHLGARGIRVLVAVTPDKSRVERAHLCALRRPGRFEDRASGWIARSRAAGVEAIDLAPALSRLPGERYFRTDSHWNEAGAESAALAIVGDLRSRGLVVEAVLPAAALESRQVRRSGDLVRVAGLDGLPDGLRPAEWVTISAVPPPEAASDDLLGEAGVPRVALVGSSYSRSANFAPFLARHLGVPIANAARRGGAFDVALRAYLESAAFRDTPPKLIVWEIPERVLEQPVTPAERAWSLERQ